MPKTTLGHISAEIERRKVLDYEIIQDENDWAEEENNKALTQEDQLLSAIYCPSDSDD